MEKKKLLNILDLIASIIIVVLFSVLIIKMSAFKTGKENFSLKTIFGEDVNPSSEVKCGVPTGKLKSLEYRGITLFWEEGNPMPEERLEIFYRVIDSLTDDLQYKYSLKKNDDVEFYYLTEGSFYMGDLTGGVPTNAAAFHRSNTIWLSPTLVDSHQHLFLHKDYNPYGPWESFDSGQIYNSGYFAMILVHEYVHAVQYNNPEYLWQYAKEVGWEVEEGDFSKPEVEESSFYNVLSEYSLCSPGEDMSETYMYSYLCGNNLEALSESRKQHVEDFWGVPREEYCQNFH